MALRSRLISDPNEVLLALDEIGSELLYSITVQTL